MSENRREFGSLHDIAVESFLLWLSVHTKKKREQLFEESAIPLIISAVENKPDLKSSAIYLLAEIELRHPDALMKHDALGFILDKPEPEKSKIHTDDYKQPTKNYFNQINSAREEVMAKLAPQVLKWLAAPDANLNEKKWFDEIANKCPNEFVKFLLGPDYRNSDEAFSLAQKINPTTLGENTLALVASAIKKEPSAEICRALKVRLSHSLENDPRNETIEEALRAAGEEPLQHYLNFLRNSRLDMRHLERISELVAKKPQDKLSHKALFEMLNAIRKVDYWKDKAERYDLAAKGQHTGTSYDAEIEEMNEDETAGKIASAVREVIAVNPKLKAGIEDVIFACAANMDDRTWKFAGSAVVVLGIGIVEKLQKMELSTDERTRKTQLFALCHFADKEKVPLSIERIPDYIWLLRSSKKDDDAARSVALLAFKAMAKAHWGDERLSSLAGPLLELAGNADNDIATEMLIAIGPPIVRPLLNEFEKHPEKAKLIQKVLDGIAKSKGKVDTGVVAKPTKPGDIEKVLSNLALDIGKNRGANTALRVRT